MKIIEEITCIECGNSEIYGLEIESNYNIKLDCSDYEEEIITKLPIRESEVSIGSFVEWEIRDWTEGKCSHCVDMAFDPIDEFGNRSEK